MKSYFGSFMTTTFAASERFSFERSMFFTSKPASSKSVHMTDFSVFSP